MPAACFRPFQLADLRRGQILLLFSLIALGAEAAEAVALPPGGHVRQSFPCPIPEAPSLWLVGTG